MDLSFLFSNECQNAAVLVSLLSVGVLVALFFYLNRFTQRGYFTVWAVAWLFYALWLTLKLSWPGGAVDSGLFLAKQLCIETAAVFLIWGSCRFLELTAPQRLMGLFLAFLYAWSFVSPHVFERVEWVELPCFTLMGLASVITGLSFVCKGEQRRFVGANLLMAGFVLWGLYLAFYPIAQRQPSTAGAAFFASAAVQLFIAVSMIILVLEEVRFTNTALAGQMQSMVDEKAALQARIETSEHERQTLAADAHLRQDFQYAYEELRAAHRSVVEQERLSVLGQVAIGIAHDINNSLTPLMGFTDLLLEDPATLPPELKKPISFIRKSGEEIARIVDRIRRFYRGRTSAEEAVPVHLNILAREVVEAARDQHQRRDPPGTAPQLDLHLDATLPPVTADMEEVRDALNQVVKNAVEAMPQGGAVAVTTRRIDSRPDIAPECLVIEIRDQGPGMDERTRTRCIEPFFTTKRPRGSGLGLSVVHGTMQRHRGQLQITSEVGAGTTVELIFPIGDAAHASVPAGDCAWLANTRRILCIDDEPVIRTLLHDVLQIYGHHVETSDGGRAGIEVFHQAHSRGEPFDAVVVDLGMPDVDGRQVVQQLRRTAPEIPIVLLTGWAAMIQPSDQLARCVNAVLQKPFRTTQLRTVLNQLTTAPRPTEAPAGEAPSSPSFTDTLLVA